MNIIKLKSIIESKYNNWIMPTKSNLSLEYDIENEKNYFFKSKDDFLKKCEDAKILEISPEMDLKILRRSRTKSYKSLLSLIKTYRSYPKYRDENTLKSIYNGFIHNNPMVYPIVVRNNNKMYVFSGNTRMDVAFQLKINPKVILIEL